MNRVLFLVLIFVISYTDGSPSGAPATQAVCESMTPNHDTAVAQESPSPYHLEVSSKSVKSGKIIKVRIIADDGRDFKGFLLMAQTNDPDVPSIGTFEADEEEETPFNFRDCYEKTRNAVTHANRDLKTKISFNWIAPDDFTGSIYFRATVVESTLSFWTDHVSDNVEITVQEPTVYDECGVTKSCIGLPNGCLITKDCVSFGAVIVKSGVYEFEMLSTNTAAYIALALSDDNFMGDDSAIECVNEIGLIKAYTSFTTAGTGSYGARRSEIDQTIITLKESRLDNGRIYCRVQRNSNTVVEGKSFDLTTEEFYLLISSGTNVNEESISYHDINRDASSSSMLFTEDNPSTTTTTTTDQPGLETEIYDECAVTKSCFGSPTGCLTTKDCLAFGAIIVKNGIYEFEMLSIDTAAFIALALSDDAYMGDDSAIECANEDGEVKAYTSFTTGAGNYGAGRTGIDQTIITLKDSQVYNGRIYCKVERVPKTVVEGKSFNLTSEEFYLLISSGTSLREGSIGYHNITREASSLSVLFTEDNPIMIVPPPTTTLEPDLENEIYDGCGTSKSCIGLPGGCVQSRNCLVFGAVIVKDGTYDFEMMSPNGATYVALALSFDTLMGRDSVIECINDNNEIRIFTSVTTAQPSNYGVRRNDDQSIIRLKEGKVENGGIYCRVERNPLTIIDDMTFDLRTTAYFLLIASGATSTELSIGYHGSSRAASSEAILFTETAVDIGLTHPKVSRTLLLIHASFMIVSWIGATSIGIFSARYCKTLWKGTQFFGKDAWFVVHQIAMTSTWILTISSAIIIWIDVGEWRTSTHSVLGIISTALCFIQPISAFFRPAPTDPARPIFNFMHGSVGKLAHFLAVITIFFATSLPRADVPRWMKFVLIAYVVIYFVFYALLMNLGIISDIKQKEINQKELEQQAPSTPPLTAARRILFMLFSIFILGLVITLINAVAL